MKGVNLRQRTLAAGVACGKTTRAEPRGKRSKSGRITNESATANHQTLKNRPTPRERRRREAGEADPRSREAPDARKDSKGLGPSKTSPPRETLERRSHRAAEALVPWRGWVARGRPRRAPSLRRGVESRTASSVRKPVTFGSPAFSVLGGALRCSGAFSLSSVRNLRGQDR